MPNIYSDYYRATENFFRQDIIEELSDEEIENQYFYPGDNVSDREDIEDVSLQEEKTIAEVDPLTEKIVQGFFSLSEGIKREDSAEKGDDQQELVIKDNYRRHTHLYSKEVGFFDDSNFNETVNFKYVILSIVSVFLKVFVGIENFNAKPNALDAKKMKLILSANSELWMDQLKSLYTKKFNEKIAQMITSSTDLIDFKLKYSSELLNERFFLYGQIALGIIAKHFNKRNYMFLAVGSSILTSIGMLVHYGKVSISESKKAADLRLLAEEANLETSKYKTRVTRGFAI